MSMERNSRELRNPVLNRGELDGASSSERGFQRVSRRYHTREAPSLFALCYSNGISHLSKLAFKLQALPDDLTIQLIRGFLRRVPAASVKELRDFCCQVYWVRQTLCHCEISQSLSRPILPYVLISNLVRLDLGGCPWLDNLEFLNELGRLECLSLRGCWRLGDRELIYVQGLRQLQCLDIERIPNVSNNLFYAISELPYLWALNVSNTNVSDYFVELLTYGSRLRIWASQRNTVIEQNLLTQYQVFKLMYFRLCGTQITDASITYLQAMPELLLLDVRRCGNVTGRAVSSLRAMPHLLLLDVRCCADVTERTLSSLRAKHRLMPLLNNNRLAARTNAMLAGVLTDVCGCRAMPLREEVTDEVTKLCQQAFLQLLHKSDFEWLVFYVREDIRTQDSFFSIGEDIKRQHSLFHR